jgi:hypothetical protein
MFEEEAAYALHDLCSQCTNIRARRACACAVWDASKQEALVQRQLQLQRARAEEVERLTDFVDGAGAQVLQRVDRAREGDDANAAAGVAEMMRLLTPVRVCCS